MTRINVIPVTELSRLHLIAEYRELPRVVSLAVKAHARGCDPEIYLKIFPKYLLGPGHVMFFYPRLKFLNKRFTDICVEMRRRRYTTNYDPAALFMNARHLPPAWWNDYTVSDNDRKLNTDRIERRV